MTKNQIPRFEIIPLILVAFGLLALVACDIGPITPPVINLAPTAHAGTNQNVEVGERVELTGLGSTDPDDDPLTFSWEQRSGSSVTLDNRNSAEPSFVPAEEGTCEFALIVTDGRGGSDEATVRIVVGEPPDPTCPRADAGTDRTVDEGSAVTLRGGNSADPSGDPLTYDWYQLSGDEVSINGVFNAEPSFAAPQVTGADIELEFELTVTNRQGCSDTDTVIITVRDRDPSDPCNGVVCEDDGRFCNGVESCDEGNCVSSGNPCPPSKTCDEDNDTCVDCLVDSDCNDEDVCTIDECVDGECIYTPTECPDGQLCDPETGECVVALACMEDTDCDDEDVCTIDECLDGECIYTPTECPDGQVCDPETGECVEICTSDADCDDGLFCNGSEVCNEEGVCVSGEAPCSAGEVCDEASNSCGCVGTMESGETVSSCIDTAAAQDTWTFCGTAGDRVRIIWAETSGDLSVQPSLYPPEGGNEEYGSIIEIDHQLAETGQYTLVIQDFGSDDTGCYDMSLLNVTAGPLTSIDDPDGGPIASGDTVSGEISTPGDMDAFIFYGTAGQRVVITWSETSGELGAQVYLYPPVGGESEDDSIIDIDHQLAETGQYTIVIQDFGENDTGAYNLSLQVF